MGIKGFRCVKLTTSLPSTNQLSRKYGSFNVSQSNRPPWSVIGIAMLPKWYAGMARFPIESENCEAQDYIQTVDDFVSRQLR
jgi:hypothetical protein